MQLRNFYRDYYKWYKAETAAIPFHSPTPFHPDTGLCDNLNSWIYYHDRENYEMEYWRLLGRLLTSFTNAGLNEDYPFGEREYLTKKGISDPNRISWVKKHLR